MKHSILTKYRRLMALALALLMVVSLTGCFAKDDPDPTDEPTNAVVPTDPTDSSEKPTDEPTDATDPSEAPTDPAEKTVMGTVSANNLNVRSNPSTDSTVLSQLPVNLRIEVLEQKTVGGTNWGRIGEMTLTNGTKISGGWINLHYVKLDNADDQDSTQPTTGSNTGTNVNDDEEAEGSITATQLYIRKGAGSTYDTAGSYKKGDRVTILETKTVSGTTWGRTDKGWISMTYVKLDGSAGSAIDTGTNVAGPGANLGGNTGSGSGSGSSSSDKDSDIESNGKTTALGWIVIDTGSLNLRKGPGTKYDTNGSVTNGDRYQYFQTSGNWLRIEKGWVSKSYVYVEGTTADDACTGTVKADEMNVRQGPGPGYKSLDTIKKGDSLVILGQANGWGYTEMGWVKMEYIDIGDGKITYKTGKGIVIADGLNVRKEAKASSDSLAVLDEDDKVTILEVGGEDKNWGKIEYASGKYGWINLRYVKMEGAETPTEAPTTAPTTPAATTYAVKIDTAITNGKVTANAAYAKDSVVALTVTPDAGYKLSTLTVTSGTTTISYNSEYKFIMPGAEVTVTATFVEADYTITYKAEHGSVTGPATAKYEDVVSLTVGAADAYYEFDKVVVTDASGKELPLVANQFNMPASNVTVTATFKAIDYTITVAETTHGKVEAPAKANKGDVITVKYTPDEGYELDTITVSGGATVEGDKFFMPGSNVTVTVTFKATTP